MIGRLHHVVIDCPDPSALARFYSQLLGLSVTHEGDDWVVITKNDTSSGVALQRAPDHQPPRRPDPRRPQQHHMDVMVDDVATAEPQVLTLWRTTTAGQAHHVEGLRRPIRASLLPDTAARLGCPDPRHPRRVTVTATTLSALGRPTRGIDMTDPSTLSEDDPRWHTIKARQRLSELVEHLRQDVGKIGDPRAEALFETAAEVLTGLQKAFVDFKARNEPAWRR